MRIGELSRRTGVAIPTIKYYVREGLLPPGELTSPNQADYSEEHERRLRLVRALVTVGGLPVATARQVLEAVTAPEHPTHEVLGIAQKSAASPTSGELTAPPAEREHAERRVAELIARRGWPSGPEHPAVRTLVSALAAMEHLGHRSFPDRLDQHAAAAELIAEADLEGIRPDWSREAMAENVVIGTVLGDTALAALRRLAQHHASASRYAEPNAAGEGSGGARDGGGGGADGGERAGGGRRDG